MPSNLYEQFSEFKGQLDRLPKAKEPPSTTLQILGRHKYERDWQRLFFYFLSPAKPHGLDHTLLKHLLTALSDRDDLGYEYSAYDLDTVQVATEVSTAEGRRPDAVMWSGEDWFLCWELKITASEGSDQTTDYVSTESFPSIGLSKENVPTDGHHYVYLAPEDASSPTADAFVQISWEWVTEQLQSFLAASHGTYPAQTTAQLYEFSSTIQRELQMTEYQENQKEKAQLYFEYYDEIAAAEDAFKKQWSEFADTWGTQLVQALDVGKIVELPEISETNIAVEIQTHGGDTERWVFWQGNSDWAGIVKEGWWRHGETLSNVYSVADDRDDFRISLYHRLTENRERAVQDNILELQLWHGTGNGDRFMYDFKGEIAVKMDERADAFPATAEYTARRGNPIVITYNIPINKYDDFFKAYVAALNDAFIDIAVNHAEFVTIVDQIYQRLIDKHT